MQEIENTFSFLWQYLSLSDDDIHMKTQSFTDIYKDDVSEDLIQEVLDLKTIHVANFGDKELAPFNLQQKLHENKLQPLFCNCTIALCIFCTISATVSKLKIMNQQRFPDLRMLSIEQNIARNLDYSYIITHFAQQRARKVLL